MKLFVVLSGTSLISSIKMIPIMMLLSLTSFAQPGNETTLADNTLGRIAGIEDNEVRSPNIPQAVLKIYEAVFSNKKLIDAFGEAKQVKIGKMPRDFRIKYSDFRDGIKLEKMMVIRAKPNELFHSRHQEIQVWDILFHQAVDQKKGKPIKSGFHSLQKGTVFYVEFSYHKKNSLTRAAYFIGIHDGEIVETAYEY